MDAALQIKYDAIKEKIKQLIEKQVITSEELAVTKAENEALERIIKSQNEELKSFQNQDKISKIVTSVSVEGNANSEKTTALKLKLNEYIKEIDKCISHLSK